ncbi:SURF1 family protein [Shewanella sp. MF05960]|uniref:SURF1 family protein n=1 Tax=Shewanella sp. MF05960 TaxID=3434874 RepID=UPI003D7A6E95
MNISNETKTNLTSNGAVTGNPFSSVGVSRVLLVLITVSVFWILVKLGFWQLARAEYKEQWQATLAMRQQQAPLDYQQLLTLMNPNAPTDAAPETALLTGYRLSIQATPLKQPLLLLDNQVYQGKVGYLAYQLFEVTVDTPWILVELGFVPAGNDRRELPALTPILAGQYQLTGRIYQKQANPLSDELHPEIHTGKPIRFQNINIPALTLLLKHDIATAVLQPDNVPQHSLPQPWVPIPLSAQKHQGYSLQWFTMAAVFLGLMGWIMYKQYRRQQKRH